MDFFNKLGNKISNGANIVVNKTKDFTDTTKLNMHISEYKDDIESTYILLGKQVYEASKKGSQPVIQQYIEKIDELYKKIQEEQAQIDIIKGYNTCPKCGAVVEKGAKFCNNCGFLMENMTQTSALEGTVVNQPVCKKCGNVLAVGAKFCPKCGTPVASQQNVAQIETGKSNSQTMDFFGTDNRYNK